MAVPLICVAIWYWIWKGVVFLDLVMLILVFVDIEKGGGYLR